MHTFTFNCPNCQQKLEIDKSLFGQTVVCPNCALDLKLSNQPIFNNGPDVDCVNEPILRDEKQTPTVNKENLNLKVSEPEIQENRIVFIEHPHFFERAKYIVIFCIFTLLLMGCLGVFIITMLNAILTSELIVVLIYLAFIFGISAGISLILFLANIKKTYILDHEKIVFRWGLFTMNKKTIYIKDIRSIDVRQGLVQSFVACGKIRISSAGTSAFNDMVLTYVPKYEARANDIEILKKACM